MGPLPQPNKIRKKSPLELEDEGEDEIISDEELDNPLSSSTMTDATSGISHAAPPDEGGDDDEEVPLPTGFVPGTLPQPTKSRSRAKPKSRPKAKSRAPKKTTSGPAPADEAPPKG